MSQKVREPSGWIQPLECFLLCLFAVPLLADGELETQTVDGRNFSVAKGLVLERFVDPSLTERPISAALDRHGRLFITEASGTNAPSKEQVVDRPHRVVVLTDEDGDGRFDHRKVFADQLMLPEGILCHEDEIYVAAPPEIWKFKDTDGDLVADTREVWLDAKTLTGCANDLHGPFIGRDGWIYWCKGAFAEQAWPQPHNPQWRTKAAHVFRRHPHTGIVEPVYTSGMDNPVELAFSASGERFVCGTFLVHPAAGQRDGLVHAVYGGVYGKPHQAIDGQWRTSPNLMPIMQHLGPAAPAAVSCLDTPGLGDSLQGSLVVAHFNLQQVTAHRLQESGATFASTEQVLVRSAHVDFHPTDLIETEDGSLLIVDTGGWYRLCCPTSHLDQSVALGGIYRLSAKGHDAAKQWLAAYDPTRTKENEAYELDRCWKQVQSGSPESLKALRALIDHTDPTIRRVAMHGLGLWRDPQSLDGLLRSLSGKNIADARAAAEALGRLRNPKAIESLLRVASETSDPVLRHSSLYAVMEIGGLDQVRGFLDSTVDTPLKLSAAVVIDQLASPADQSQWIPTQELLTWLGSSSEKDRRVVTWLLSHRQDASMEVVHWIAKLDALPPGEAIANGLELVRVSNLDEATKESMAPWFHREELEWRKDFATTLLRSINPGEIPTSWDEVLANRLNQSVERKENFLKSFAIDRKETVKVPAFRAALLALLQTTTASVDDRLRAYLLTGGEKPEDHTEIFQVALAQLTSDQAVELRQLALMAFSRIPTRALDARVLLETLPHTGPLETRTVLESLARSTEAKDAEPLQRALRSATQLTVVPGNELTDLFRKSPAEIRETVARFRADAELSMADQRARLDDLLQALPPGNRLRGLEVFRSSKAACSACHSIGYVGGKTGPDLSRIGSVRTRMDLLEAIVYPSQSFVRSYEPVTVLTLSGQVFSGLEQPGTPSELVLLTGANTIQRIPRKDIESVEPGKVSVMPAGLERQLSSQELADLLSLLGEAK